MRKIIRFSNMSVVIPMKDHETQEEIEDRLIEAMENIGSRCTSYRIKIEEEDDE